MTGVELLLRVKSAVIVMSEATVKPAGGTITTMIIITMVSVIINLEG
jgi:hypothetical protein